MPVLKTLELSTTRLVKISKAPRPYELTGKKFLKRPVFLNTEKAKK